MVLLIVQWGWKMDNYYSCSMHIEPSYKLTYFESTPVTFENKSSYFHYYIQVRHSRVDLISPDIYLNKMNV